MHAFRKSSTVGAYEAKTCLPALIKRVEHGEEVVITRRGKPVARITPIIEVDRRAAFAAIRAFRGTIKLPRGMTVKDLINEGRKY